MLACRAKGCLSNETTKIDGKVVLLFSFPDDATQRSDWFKNCQLDESNAVDKPLYLCELHFDKTSFTESKELKPNVVPTIFDEINDNQRKRKADSELESSVSKVLPEKQKKLDNDLHNIETPLQSPTELTQNVEEMNRKNNIDPSLDLETIVNGSEHIKSELYHEAELEKTVYRLTIQIDKIYGKPCPKSQKLKLLAQVMKGADQFSGNLNTKDQQNKSFENVNKKAICAEGGCKLKKSVYDSKPAFQCEHCDKYFIMKKNDNRGGKNTCTICQKTFISSQLLYFHSKSCFVCDICQTEYCSQITYNKHIRLHVSTDPEYPYKCHHCAETFILKEDVRQHYIIVHPTIKFQNTILQATAPPLTPPVAQQQDYRCVSCNITFRNEQAYRNHISSHKKKEGLRCSIGESTNNVFPVPNPLTGSQIGILRAVKFSCRVCSMEFDNVGEVDKHTRTHLEEDEEERKCNICQKLFKTSAELHEHLKYHLSRAHSCPVCSKVFINRTTLKIHLKTHGET